MVLPGLDGEFGMRDHQALVAEDGDAGDGVHVLLVQETDELGHVVDVDPCCSPSRGCSKGMVTLPSESLISKTTELPPTSRQWRMMRSP